MSHRDICQASPDNINDKKWQKKWQAVIGFCKINHPAPTMNIYVAQETNSKPWIHKEIHIKEQSRSRWSCSTDVQLLKSDSPDFLLLFISLDDTSEHFQTEHWAGMQVKSNSHVFLRGTGGLSLLHGLVGSHPQLALPPLPPLPAPVLQPPSTFTCSPPTKTPFPFCSDPCRGGW